jgi:RNA polymerase sigma factor (sigma-70 family)
MIFSNHDGIKKMVQGCLKNDRHFEKELFDKYKDAMYTLVFRILRNEVLASDAVQEGFIRVFTGMANYRFESSLGSWIKIIMIRSALAMLKNEPAMQEADSGVLDLPVEWDENLTGEMLDKAISGLSPGYRAVFILVEVEGYSHKEVAEIMKISAGTSKSQLSRAKVILQQKLKEFGY